MTDDRAEGTETIAADPGALYDLVSDLTQMGKWSPEATGGSWAGGVTGPAMGATFHGDNRCGWRRWSTTSKITTADRGQRFAFRVTVARVPISEWSYDFEPDGDGTRVIERWHDLRPGWMNVVSGPVSGVDDRATHSEQNIATTLTALKRAAESG